MSTAANEQPVHADTRRDIDERVADLLGRMTLQEKLAQLGSAWAFQLLSGTEFSPARARDILAHGIGQITRIGGSTSLGAGEAAALANAIQRHLVEETRLGIPAIIHEEICSGVMARETTIYPQAIGVASTFDPDLVERMAAAIRTQMRAAGAHQGLSPVLDVCRDPRWGRLEETFGEDPHLVARIGAAFVRGLQGDDLRHGVAATAKHFVGYGASEGGLNWAPAHIPPRELREVHLHPFEAAVREAGLAAVMNGYHELDGVPCGASRELLTDVLRDGWGFDGIVVSDYFSVDQLRTYHQLVPDQPAAAATALTAGIDVELPSTNCYGDPLAEALADGAVDRDVLDRAVARVLRLKLELGLFEQPYVDVDGARAAAAAPAHHELALEIARKSIVLLSNPHGLLPLAATTRRVAVIGPNAHDARNLLGDYTYPAHMESLLEMRDADNVFGMPIPDDYQPGDTTVGVPTVLDALRERLDGEVVHARGCDVASDDTSGFEEAVAAAAAADVAVLVLGDKAGLTDDCTSGEGRDRASLDLPGVQEQLVEAVTATGTPVVAVLVAGRPVGSDVLHERCGAVLMAWLPGEAGGRAIAEILTGETNPSGKLPVSYPRSVGQVPVVYRHKVSGGRSHWKGAYVDSPTRPRHPFGHGLTYTRFSIDDAAVMPGAVPVGGSATVTAQVTNRGDRPGEEVLQLYVRDPAASVTRPVLELKGFVRVPARPGQTRTVTFDLPTGMLGLYDHALDYVVEPGVIEVHVGFSAGDLVPAGTFEITSAGGAEPVNKVFTGAATVT